MRQIEYKIKLIESYIHKITNVNALLQCYNRLNYYKSLL